MKKKWICLLLVLVLAIGLLAGCGKDDGGDDGNAEDASWDYIVEKGTLVMGLDDSFPPMGFNDEDGNIVGFDVDVAKEVASRLGVELVLQPINWDSKDQELNTKNIDMIWNGFSVTDERKETYTLSVPYMDNNMAMVVRADAGIASLADLEGKKVAVQAGSSAGIALDEMADFKATLAEVVELSDNVQCLMNLESEAVDAVLMDDVVARYYIAQNEKDFVVLDNAEDVIVSEEYAIGFRKGEEALKAAVEEKLAEMAADGTLAEISTKWFGSDVTKIQAAE